MTRVAVVRGPFLNPFDMGPFHHVGWPYEIVAVAARHCFTESTSTGLAVRRLPCLETEISTRHGRQINRLPWFFGRGYSLLGLERALADADVVHTAETYMGFSLQSAQIAARSGTPLIVTVKETIPDGEMLHPVRRLGREQRTKRMVQGATALFIAVSRAAALALEMEGVEADRIVVIPPAVDVALFSGGERLRGPELRILFVGPALWRKGIFEAVRALALVNRVVPARLIVVGGGADLGAALRIAGGLGLSSRVETIPRVPHAAMAGIMAKADVLLAPSISTRTWQEQDSMAVLEAMASALPVVATPGGIRRELLGDEAYWMAQGDFTEASDRLLEIAEAPSEAQVRASRLADRARQRHDLPIVGAQIRSAYDRVLGAGFANARRV